MSETRPPQRVKAKAIGKYPRYTGIEIPEGAEYVGREDRAWPGSPFANPSKPAGETKQAYQECVDEYRDWLLSQPELVHQARVELRGVDLACWKHKPGFACHADVLLAVSNSRENSGTEAVLP
jgi:hypothetical protein